LKAPFAILCAASTILVGACQQQIQPSKAPAIQRVDLRAADISEANIARLKELPPLELYVGFATDGRLIGDYPEFDAEISSIYTGERKIVAATVAEIHHRAHKFKKFPTTLDDSFDDFALLITRPETEIPSHTGCHLIKMYYSPVQDDQEPHVSVSGEFYFVKGEIVYVVFGTDGSFVSISLAKVFPPEGLIESEAPLEKEPKVMTTMPPKNP
jgi:hypothetical protein